MRRKGYLRTTYYRARDSTIHVTGKVNSYNVKDFITGLIKFQESGTNNLTIDFSDVKLAYPSGMLPIISSLHALEKKNANVYVKLPNNDNTRKLFRSVNWAHYLSPSQFEKSESIHDRHLVTQFFDDHTQQKRVVYLLVYFSFFGDPP